jgi:hypothetical protein
MRPRNGRSLSGTPGCAGTGRRSKRADPVPVTGWMNETQARHAAAEARLKKPTGRRRMTRDEITSLVSALGDVMQVLKDADPADKAEIYGRLGLTLTHHPQDKRVEAEAQPNSIMYVGACPRSDCTESRCILAAEFVL